MRDRGRHRQRDKGRERETQKDRHTERNRETGRPTEGGTEQFCKCIYWRLKATYMILFFCSVYHFSGLLIGFTPAHFELH